MTKKETKQYVFFTATNGYLFVPGGYFRENKFGHHIVEVKVEVPEAIVDFNPEEFARRCSAVWIHLFTENVSTHPVIKDSHSIGPTLAQKSGNGENSHTQRLDDPHLGCHN